MPYFHYFADGYELQAPGPVRQSAWVCFFNPCPREAEIQFTFYYEDCEPSTMTHRVKGETGGNIHLASCPQVNRNKRFGAKIVTSEPMVIQVTTGYYGVEDMEDWYTRGMHSVICSPQLSRELYYADALVIDVEGQRLREPEWAFILNPNLEPADVILYAFYNDGTQVKYPFHVQPERVLPVFMDELVVKNKIFGARYVSTVPVAIQQTRLILEEDRKTIRSCFSVMAVPGDIPG